MPLLSPDKYGILLYGTLAERPAANTIGEKAIYFCLGDENEGIIFVKPHKDSDWVATQFPGMAPSPHNNLHHMPHFAEITHLHPLADITGTLAIGWLSVVDYPDVPVQTGVIHSETLPSMAITGTAVQIYAATLGLYTAPTSGPVTVTATLDGASLVSVTAPIGSKWATATIPSPPVVAAGNVIQITGPAKDYGATGMDFKLLFRRVRAA